MHKDQPPNETSPPSSHSSLLYADWLSTALSGHASMDKDRQSAYIHTIKGSNSAGRTAKMFATNYNIWQQIIASACIFKGAVTSGHGGLRFGDWSRFLKATWMLSPCLRGPLGVKLSSHGHVFLGFILPPLTVTPSELELVPGRGAVMAHSSWKTGGGGTLAELRRK